MAQDSLALALFGSIHLWLQLQLLGLALCTNSVQSLDMQHLLIHRAAPPRPQFGTHRPATGSPTFERQFCVRSTGA
ncbi:hypothetical protein EJ05DRAFT_476339 [Pseudovirgaria hyperparasitica]|uniref:Secreted protein n=1 Tax=Pseudovirgaria hyperparasitica TaxID=470096 RepID=A0A6A6W562_9PEZI|nr:uncharacterized protein EJ05DRAFT_476339 [Pseudovirgaria hyperparasitica]KAF2758068.1 hypothetical protein EJ05DRAFT_476339 [Pseudovirgaria hyperparasitica]